MENSIPLNHSTVDEELQYRIAFEKLITGISTNFINLALEEIDGGIVHALQKVCEYTGYDRSYVILFSQDGKEIDTIYEWCAEGVTPQGQCFKDRPAETLPWLRPGVRLQAIVQLEDIDELRAEAGFENLDSQGERLRSILLLPMSYRDQSIGILGFDSLTEPKQWPEEVTVLLKIVGEIFVNALQRKRADVALREAYQTLEKRVEERTHEIERRSKAAEALRDILRVLNSNQPLPEVLSYIVTQACQLLDATSAMIRRADLEHQLVTTDAGYNLPAEFDAIRRTRLYYNANDMILMSRRPVVISDVHSTYQPLLGMTETIDEVQRVYLNALLAHYNGMLSVPLFIKNEIYGSLSFYFKEHPEFSDEDIQLAMSLGDQAALAIENARLYREEHERREEAERRRQVAESMRDTMAVLNSNRSLDDILCQILDQAVALLGTNAVAIYRMREKEGVLVIRASSGLSEECASQIRIPVGKGIAGHAVLSRKPVAVSDTQAAADESEANVALLAEERGVLESLVETYRGFLAVPLVGKDDIYGAITLYYTAARSFSQEEIDLAVAFADQASLAIENARLRSQSEQNAVAMERNRLARDLHDAVTQTLFSASLIAEVLPRLWERNPEEARRRLEELRQLSRGALAEMRTLLLELRPSALTETRLSDLLKQLAEAVTGRARLPVELTVEGEFPLNPDVQVSLYRIAQEALNNIVKHSGASKALIFLKFVQGEGSRRVELSVQDNGHGFDPSTVPPNHLGLGIMRERAQTLNASLDIASRIDIGTTITVVWTG